MYICYLLLWYVWSIKGWSEVGPSIAVVLCHPALESESCLKEQSSCSWSSKSHPVSSGIGGRGVVVIGGGVVGGVMLGSAFSGYTIWKNRYLQIKTNLIWNLSFYFLFANKNLNISV